MQPALNQNRMRTSLTLSLFLRRECQSEKSLISPGQTRVSRVISNFSPFNILGREKEIRVKDCACDSDSELVAILRARHLWYSYCDQFRIKLVHEFGLLILLRGYTTDM